MVIGTRRNSPEDQHWDEKYLRWRNHRGRDNMIRRKQIRVFWSKWRARVRCQAINKAYAVRSHWRSLNRRRLSRSFVGGIPGLNHVLLIHREIYSSRESYPALSHHLFSALYHPSIFDLFELMKKAQTVLISERNAPANAQIAAAPMASRSNWITQLTPLQKPIRPHTKELEMNRLICWSVHQTEETYRKAKVNPLM